jgi:hypothetical protein
VEGDFQDAYEQFLLYTTSEIHYHLIDSIHELLLDIAYEKLRAINEVLSSSISCPKVMHKRQGTSIVSLSVSYSSSYQAFRS